MSRTHIPAELRRSVPLFNPRCDRWTKHFRQAREAKADLLRFRAATLQRRQR